MSEVEQTDGNFVQMVLNPSKTMSNWFVGLGSLEYFLGTKLTRRDSSKLSSFMGVECLHLKSPTEHSKIFLLRLRLWFLILSSLLFVAFLPDLGSNRLMVKMEELETGLNQYSSMNVWMSLADPDWWLVQDNGCLVSIIGCYQLSILWIDSNWLDRPWCILCDHWSTIIWFCTGLCCKFTVIR